ncbi:unnamed protein product, partial [Staurois parvus]
PLAARNVNHQVPAGDSLPPPSNRRAKLTEERPVCNQHWSLSSQQGHAAVCFYQHVSLVKQTQHIM